KAFAGAWKAISAAAPVTSTSSRPSGMLRGQGLAPPPRRRLRDDMDKLIGKPLPRVEDARLVTGQGEYTDDVVLPNQAHAAFVRSPMPHAVIRGIDIEAALAAPGVIAVLT